MKKRTKAKKSKKTAIKKPYHFGKLTRIEERDVLEVMGATGLSYEALGPLIAMLPT
jgi:hypothetical protein